MSSLESIREGLSQSPVTRSGEAIDLSPAKPLLDRIISRWNPDQIWLFGSRAAGRASPSSDWDFLVVVPDQVDESEIDPMVAWRLHRGSGIRTDVVLCHASEFSEGRGTPNTLAYEAARFGVLVYER